MLFKKEKKVVKANDIIKNEILKKALSENATKTIKIEELNKRIVISLENAAELREKNENLIRNIEILQTTIENIKEICNNSNSNVISKNKILKEIGE